METFKPFSHQDKFPLTLAPAAVALVQLLVFIGIPYLISTLFNKPEIIFISLISVVFVLFLSFSVFSLTISEEGIRLKRFMGHPKLISWSEFKGISRATPKEVIIFGWLWPIFPAREMSPSVGVSGHVKIHYNNKYCFFPPESIEAFEDAIEKYRSKKF